MAGSPPLKESLLTMNFDLPLTRPLVDRQPSRLIRFYLVLSEHRFYLPPIGIRRCAFRAYSSAG